MANRACERNYQTHRLNWCKEDTERKRRKNALYSKNGSLEDTGQALLSLSKRTQNDEIRRKSYSDAVHFFALHKRKLQLQGKPVNKVRRRN